GRAIVAAGHGVGFLRIWDAHTGKPLKTFSRGQFLRLQSQITVDPTGRWLAWGGRQRSPVLWDLRLGRQIGALPAGTFTFAADGKHLVAAVRNEVELRDLETGK